MPKSIVFPRVEPFWIFERDCLAFPAIVDGVTVRCLVSHEALMQKFGAAGRSESDAVEAFRKHREVIQQTARKMIEAGHLNEGTEVLIRSKSQPYPVGFMNLVISDKIKSNSQLNSLIVAATMILTEGLFRFKETFVATWDFSDETEIFQLTLEDEDTLATARDWYTLDQLKNADLLRTSFGRLWGDLLRAKTRKQLEKIEAGARES